jgi:type I restriction enzyme S subunit
VTVETRPLWTLTSLNDDSLPDTTPGAYTFDYVDISNVTEGHISDDLETYAFRDAPSRARRVARPDDVIISTVRTYLRAIARVDETDGPTVYSTGFAVLRPDRDLVDPRYISFVLSSRQVMDEIIATSVGVSYPAIQGSALHRMRVPYCSQEKQAAIVSYLERETAEMDSVLARMDLLSEALRERARSVQTRVVFGLTAGQRHSAADAHSPLSGIPEHWDRTKFGYDFTESTERNGDDPPGPLLSISEYRGVELNTRTEGQQASLDVSKYRVVRPGQLAANMMWLNHGGLGVSSHTGYISPDYKAFWISDRFEPRYVHHLFRSSRYIDYFAAIATGVRPNAQRVTKTVLDATLVPLPPVDEQIRIADELDEATTRVDAMLAKVADLKSLLLERRAALITDVVTGKKEVA